ncbi:hypothetical protein H0264_26695 [Nocardia huaxiensis]|uniref:Uncharacterized protein n=1 Tax=Nocardia huaxiensis TaxID=2755382 RepID=A0A7D6VFG6_9NOCA|nr:hypothetical protein [Nocardia huaxiensis]QLY28896.1 hypothetical protein H0264_26695 [Nocardia huaxiensis]
MTTAGNRPVYGHTGCAVAVPEGWVVERCTVQPREGSGHSHGVATPLHHPVRPSSTPFVMEGA